MPRQEIALSKDGELDGRLVLTQFERDYLQSFLNAGDRGGFYMAYYAMTQSAEIIAPGQISTFSDALGGVAFGANYLLQDAFRDAPPASAPGELPYRGIYYLSQQVADEIFSDIIDKVENNGSTGGNFSVAEILQASQNAWARTDDPVTNNATQFPGADANDFAQTIELTSFDLSLSNVTEIIENTLNEIQRLRDAGELSFENFLDAITNIQPGTLAGLIAIAGKDILGKKRSDYQTVFGITLPGYDFIETPDGRYEIVVEEASGKTVAIFDDTFLPDSLLDIFEIGLTKLVGAPGALIGLIANETPFLSDFFSWFRRQLSESETGFDGDINPNVTNSTFDPLTYKNSEDGTSGDDTIWGKEGIGGGGFDPFGQLPDDDTLDGGAGNDFIFGGGGEDTLRGGLGNDVIYGNQDNDDLFGDGGNDILRGGEGDDTIDGGADDDVLDGGDIGILNSGVDELIGGAGDDVLIGGADGFFDTLRGGAGDDAYYLSGLTIIEDSDGVGEIFFNEESISINAEERSEGIFVDDSTGFVLTRADIDDDGDRDDLLVNHQTDERAFEILNYEDNTLGINVTPLEEVNPPTFVNTILGDFEFVDFDPVEEGIQFQYDELGNAIQDFNVPKVQDDVLNGSDDNDEFFSGDGQDRINANAGDDFIDSGLDNDDVYAGSGNDLIFGSDGDDLLFSESGDDQVEGGAGRDVLVGQDGDDRLIGGSEDDLLSGNSGDDYLDGGGENDYLTGGSGNDILIGGDGRDVLSGDSDLSATTRDWSVLYTPIFVGGVSFNVILVNSTGSIRAESSGEDFIDAGSGDDVVFGGGADDFIDGGEGNDELQGNGGGDVIYGGAGDDNILGEGPATIEADGDDYLFGEQGNDRIGGDGGNDFIDGGEGGDELQGNSGDDFIYGGEGNGQDVIDGGEGNDSLFGGGGDDLIFGRDGDDFIFGEDGNDLIIGGQGNDIIDGGSGNDVLDGGEGQDTYVINESQGLDQIFDDGDDFIVSFNGATGSANYNISTDLEGMLLYSIAFQDGSGAVLNFNNVTSNTTLNFGSNDLISGDELSGRVGGAAIFGTVLDDQGVNALIGDANPNRLEGLSGDDEIFAGFGNDWVEGGEGNDNIFGESGDDYILGGAGNDSLSGDQGNDNYAFNLGDGVDEVVDGNGIDTFRFGIGISPNDITLSQNASNDLVIQNNTDQITVLNWFVGSSNKIERFIFADGTELDIAQIEARLLQSDPPILDNPIIDLSIDEDALFTFQIPSNTFSDPNAGEILTIRVSGQGGADLPAWLTYDENTQTVSGTPTNNDLGTFSIDVTAVDPLGFNTADSFDITVNNTNDAPVINNFISNQQIFDADLFELVIPQNLFVDEDAGDTFTLNVSLADGGSLPAWLDYDVATQTFSGAPAKSDVGAFAIEITATDNNGLSSTAGFAINVQDRDIAPLGTVTKSQLTTDTGLQLLAQNDDLLAGKTADLQKVGDLVTSIGDVNGDGFDDVFVSGGTFADPASTAPSPVSAVIGYVVYGSDNFITPDIEVADIDGSDGYVIYDFSDLELESNNSTVSAVQASVTYGDSNGDGLDDIFVRDKIILGRENESRTELDLSQFNDIQTSEVIDVTTGNYEVIFAGDINGDGFNDAVFKALDDLILPGTNLPVINLVVFGDVNGIPTNIDPASLDGTNGFRLITTNWDTYNIPAIAATSDDFAFDFADVNGDGLVDILTNGIRSFRPEVTEAPGQIIFGSTIFDPEFNSASNTDKTKGVQLFPNNYTPTFVNGFKYSSVLKSIGDFNGDGYDDFSTTTGGEYDGEIYFGGPNLGTTNTFLGVDNFVELVISGEDPTGFVLIDSTAFEVPVTFPFAQANYTSDPGLKFSIEAAGDINGDGLDDIVARVYGAVIEEIFPGDEFNPQEILVTPENSYEIVIYGSSDPLASPPFGQFVFIRDFFENNSRNGSGGFVITPSGNAFSESHEGVGAAGDFNGDGFDDVIAGDHFSDSNSGSAFVIYGDDYLKQADFPGSPADDIIYVTGNNSSVYGLGGNDIINVSPGTTGTTRINAGSGNDRIAFTGGGGGISGPSFTRRYEIRGGAGNDTYDFSNLGNGSGSGFGAGDTIVIFDPLSTNIIVFGNNVFANGILISFGSLKITIGDEFPTIILKDFDPNDVLGGPRSIDLFQFADGSELTFEQLVSRGFDIDGTDISDDLSGTNLVDRINGFDGNDTLDAGQGNDIVNGGLGSDTYVYSIGDGIDIIIEEGGLDTLQIKGTILQSNITATQNGLDLVLELPGTDQITVQNWFDSSQDNKIEFIQYFDGADTQFLSFSSQFPNIPVNQSPILENVIAAQTAVDDVEFSFTLPSNIFTDPDATDVLAYDAALIDGSFLPTWLTFDELTQTFSGTPGDSNLGALDIRVTATDTSNASVFGDFTLTINDANDSPFIIGAIPNQPAYEDVAFSFQANAFADIDAGDSLTYNATQGDGSALPSWLSFDAITQTFSGTPTNDDVGALILRVTATDNASESVSDNFDLTIINTNDAPTLESNIADQSATQDSVFSFIVPGNTFADPDVGDLVRLNSTLNDGSELPTWLSFNLLTNTFSGTPTSADIGDINVQVTATDFGGLSVFDDFVLTVNEAAANNPPVVANVIVDQATDEDAAFNFVVPANTFNDPDAGDTLAYNATLIDGSVLPSWLNFDALTLTFNGTPLNDDVGAVSVRVTATDTSNESVFDDFELTVNNVNDAPIVANAIADQTTDEDAAFSFTIPANTFSDDDTIHADTLTFIATQADGSALPTWLNFDAITQIFSGTPLNDDVGNISVRVTATDGSSASVFDDFDITINNTNDAPVVSNVIADQVTDEDVAFSFTVPANTFSDPDVGDMLTYSATLSDGSALPSWLSFDAATQTFSGTPLDGDVGIVDVRITATDTSNATVFDDFSVTVNDVAEPNTPPVVANAIADQASDEDAVLNFAVPANTFSDPDVGDTLIYSATLSNGSALPTWLNFDAATQTFGGTPENADVGILSVRVTATDTSNESVFDDFDLTINNTNDAPTVANLIADQTADEDTAFNFAVPANSFDDVDVGDTLIYSASLSDGSALPSWLVFDAVTQTFSGTPANGDVGAVDVRVTATDSSNASVSDDFTLTVEAGNTFNLIEGNGQNNILIGTLNADRILGKGGDDVLRGQGDNDELIGGNGWDDLFGNAGDDLLDGGNGRDYLDGGNGNDHLKGGDGRDFLYGWNGNDTLEGGAGNDDLYGEAGNDLLKGNAGRDFLFGGGGNDHLKGNGGNDDLFGGGDNDTLEGGAGVDFLHGENGNDTLNGGAGNDELRGDAGSDIYQLNRGDGQDLIRDTNNPNNNDIDQIQYGAGITKEEVWFDRSGNHLDVYTLGSDDKVQIRNWYNQPNRRIEEFTTQGGATLNDEDVQTLVNAMAAFGAPVNGEVTLTPQEEQQLQTVIAATWQ